ncbi:HD domain-containing protein [Clostridioides mangenotii]|uniref:HDIG domain-containing metalloprotein n=2 Tax=Metaclostridioides mangenotii TaxID=1540 RepID=UPI001C111A37|nr:HDIG domain-containing metalloprotein [Clostridioides mangenotii]MBU5307479.1 HD domain-containing protein [Clostridioides mangenotii]
MIAKRVRQFFINISDRMNKNDIKYVKEKLNDKEEELFFKLLKSEQKHSVRIATDIENLIDSKEIRDEELVSNKQKLIKVALLHDVGKARKRLNVIDKSIIVILAKITNQKLKNIEFSEKVKCYYFHSEYSYELLEDIIKDKEILYIIKNHHNDIDDKLINFFQAVDDKN